MRRTSLHLFIAIVIATSAFAQQKLADKGAPDAERLRAHVTYLASEKTEGRKTGSPGAQLAAEYIAKEFARYGLKHPHFDKSSEPKREGGWHSHGYLQSFPYVAGVELGKNNSMALGPQALDLRVGEDWLPLGWGANARVEKLPVTYVGYGISATDLNHDDYAGVDVRGRIVLAFAGTPDGDNPHSQFARFADDRLKAVAARDHGAKALVLIAREENFRDDKLSRLGYDNAGTEAGLPVVAISRQVARRALEAAANMTVPLDELQKAAGGARAAGGTGSSRKNFSDALSNVAFSISTDVVRRERPAYNVIGILEGRDPRLKHEAVVIGAHYDHLGRGGHGSLAGREGDIHHGADDNASGTAGLLELARLLSGERAALRRTVVFIAFGGEEEGLLGSNYYVNHAVVPLAQTVAMFNMDMVGRLRDDRLVVGGVGTATEWKAWIEQANTGVGVKVVASPGSPHAGGSSASMVSMGANGQPTANIDVTPRFTLSLSEDGFGPSDHSSFYAKKTPVLFFYTGSHEDYHKPSDTADRINYTGLARILTFVRGLVQTTAAGDQRPTYAVAKSEGMRRSTSFRVYLGTVPNYAEGDEGLKLDAVRDDSPAAKAGLRAGDVIVKMAGREVRNVYDYTYALSEMKAGQEYEIEVLREGARVPLKIVPAARR